MRGTGNAEWQMKIGTGETAPQCKASVRAQGHGAARNGMECEMKHQIAQQQQRRAHSCVLCAVAEHVSTAALKRAVFCIRKQIFVALHCALSALFVRRRCAPCVCQSPARSLARFLPLPKNTRPASAPPYPTRAPSHALFLSVTTVPFVQPDAPLNKNRPVHPAPLRSAPFCAPLHSVPFRSLAFRTCRPPGAQRACSAAALYGAWIRRATGGICGSV